jgi:hypothetical protein
MDWICSSEMATSFSSEEAERAIARFGGEKFPCPIPGIFLVARNQNGCFEFLRGPQQ